MKRAILVLMLVVFALVTVVPTFAMPQKAETIVLEDGIIVEGGIIIIDGVIMPDGGAVKAGIIWDGTIILEEGSIIAIRKAGGEQQEW